MNLAEIFRKANPSAVPPRVPVREVGQKKIQEVNQEVTEMKRSLQSNSFTNAEHLSVPIVLEYPDEIQPLNSAKKIQPIRSQNLTVTPKIGKFPKLIFEK